MTVNRRYAEAMSESLAGDRRCFYPCTPAMSVVRESLATEIQRVKGQSDRGLLAMAQMTRKPVRRSISPRVYRPSRGL